MSFFDGFFVVLCLTKRGVGVTLYADVSTQTQRVLITKERGLMHGIR